jgi:predicted nucleotidyltransferase
MYRTEHPWIEKEDQEDQDRQSFAKRKDSEWAFMSAGKRCVQIEFQCWRTRMRPSIALQENRAAIRSVVERHRARNARVFGSVLHGDDQEGSDLDILIDPTPDTTMFDIGAIRHELLQLLGVPVDVLTPNALPDSFRAQVIAEARPV